VPEESRLRRYDLVSDLGEWLCFKGLITRKQHEKAEASQLFGMECGRWDSIDKILIDQGAVSRDQVEMARRTMTLFDGLDPGQDPMLQPPGSKLLILLLKIVVNASATALRFMPTSKSFHLHYRVDGGWYELPSPPLQLVGPLLDVLRRVAPEGRLLVRSQGKPADLLLNPAAPTADRELLLEIAYPGV
jgi:hypothetical protein